ncbi:lysine N(6)-hydroxylase/L-ornithine N(5)-oxygenase family protein [Haloechinothrix halophila]|uniref:lysine N(6)-hydroxylase/L-ornithine N(5)-oxygenase family protein n=1 Tax=Haloechinothrix halophila TaxID=1069073 RepID=UPI00040C6235|nr:SidA/IucD/PvdA family monooxygenase [Haloechinothrix halophila]
MTSDRADHDVVAIGCGPFNLGLAALADGVDDVDLVVFEERPEFRWHPGLMFDEALLQVSFLADLVTLVEPTHPLSFLAYLRDVDRMYPFYVRERFHPTRREYEDYLRWAASTVDTIRFGHRVSSVSWEPSSERFVLDVDRGAGGTMTVSARHLVLGVGTEPAVAEALTDLPAERLLHTGDYLHRLDDVTSADRVSVVGSGQSGAEVVLDLLRRNTEGGPAVNWLTRTESFAPLDYSKLVLEMTTPAYVEYFHGLPDDTRDELVARQWRHYKGVSEETLEEIHDVLYRRELCDGPAPVELRCGVAVEGAVVDADTGDVVLTCRQRDTGRRFEHRTDVVVAATGYRQRVPGCLGPMESLVRRDAHGRYRVRLDHSIELAPAVTGKVFVANADLHSHGVAAPDLGIGAYRNATILNAVTGREVYRLPKNTAFTSFAAPG